MARRLSPSQIRSQMRQAQQKQRQAIAKYNNAVRNYNNAARRFNADLKRAVDSYNREVRAHNTRVRTNRQRLNREISKLSATRTTTLYVTYRNSVQSLRESFGRIEARAEAGAWAGGDDLFDLSEGETANSVAVLNVLIGEPDQVVDQGGAELNETVITKELMQVAPDLDARWRGALFALNPANPDAARHFCTSSREILATILESEAPDEAVIASNPHYERTPDGGVSRRARVRYVLERRGTYDPELEAFIEEDIDNIITLFRDFNDGTHGSAGRFDLVQLKAIKKRVEDAIQFLLRVVR